MRVYYDRDADVNLIKGKKVLVVGYGSQGHAHAMNLRDSGVKDVRIALKPGSATIKKAEGAGFTVMSPADGAKWADIVMVLTPDELQSDIYSADVAIDRALSRLLTATLSYEAAYFDIDFEPKPWTHTRAPGMSIFIRLAASALMTKTPCPVAS